MSISKKRIWGWYFFDWASQPYNTLLMTFIFGPYFASIASDYFLSTGLKETAADARAQTMWSWTLAAVGLMVGLCAPIFGAIADTSGRKIPWVAMFSVLCFLGALGIWYTMPDGSNLVWGLMCFAVAFAGAEFAFIFVNSQLPSVCTEEDMGKVSGMGFAFGYAGGLIGLFIMLLLFVEQGSGKTLIGLDPAFGLDADKLEGTRFVGPFTAIWFAIFTIPYFLWVKDTGPELAGNVRQALAALWALIKSLRLRKSLTNYLVSSMFYRDALNGLYGFGGTYAVLVLDWEITQIGIFGIVGAATAVVFSWIGGRLDSRFGPKPVITAAILVLIAVCIVVLSMSRESFMGMQLAEGSSLPDQVFFVCGALIGGMGGVLQAASRTLMARHTSEKDVTELFGLYGLAGRATAFMAPWLIGVVTAITESARLGISPLVILFVIGLFLLRYVNPQGGQA
ncbi:MAG: MFS transporter [Marinovum sp.]|nr:MFS transporter [Marinovum sp.]